MTAPAAAGSPLSSLRDRRKRATEALTLDLEVPRLNPPVFVRFSPVAQSDVDRLQTKVSKSKDPERTVRANAALLAKACVGVFERVDGREVSVDPEDRDGEWPRFDARLADLLGEDVDGDVDCVRALYLTDGDVISASGALARWSGYRIAEIDEYDSGN